MKLKMNTINDPIHSGQKTFQHSLISGFCLNANGLNFHSLLIGCCLVENQKCPLIIQIIIVIRQLFERVSVVKMSSITHTYKYARLNKILNICVEMKTSISSQRVPSRRTVLFSQSISCFNLVLHNYKPSIIQTFGFSEFGTKVLIKHLLVWVQL